MRWRRVARRGGIRVLALALVASTTVVARPPSAAAAPPAFGSLGLAQTTTSTITFPGGFAFQVDETAQGGTDLNGDGDATDTAVWHVYRPSTGVINLGLATSGNTGLHEYDEGIVIWADEVLQDQDLNNDGDKLDEAVVFVYSFKEGLVPLQLAAGSPGAVWRVSNGFAFWVDEAKQGNTDLNGDTDTTDQRVWHVYDPGAGVTNLGLAASAFVLSGDRRIGDGFMFWVDEFSEGTDLNNDSDTTDNTVWHLWDPLSGTTNLEIAGPQPSSRAIDGGVAFVAGEAGQDFDYNGDGDKLDLVWLVWVEATQTIFNSGRASSSLTSWAAGDGFAFLVSETDDGATGSLNGDGDDTDETVVHVYSVAGGLTNLQLAPDPVIVVPIEDGFAVQVSEIAQDAILNGDGDKLDARVWHVWRQGSVTNLGLATDAAIGEAYLDGLAFVVDESQQAASTDLNGDGDFVDTRVVHIWDPNSGVTNLLLAVSGIDLIASHDVLGFSVSETHHGGVDLNGDADDNDLVRHVYTPGAGVTNLNLARSFPKEEQPFGNGIAFTVGEGVQGGVDLNGDADTTDTTVWMTYDPVNGVVNLGLASERISGFMITAPFGSGLGFTVNEALQGGSDRNFDADGTDIAVWHVVHGPSVVRYAGADRYLTAGAIADGDFPDPSLVSTVFVAVGSNFPDALAGAAVAAKLGAPLLLVQPDSIPPATSAALTRLKPTTIVILGGTAAISPGVETALGGYGAGVTRLSGANRYITAVEISKYGFPANGSADIVVVATGTGFADALAGGPAAFRGNGPVLLTDPNSLPGEVAAEITRLAPTRIVVAGGTSAVSQAVFDQLQALVANTDRISGANRYETAVAISLDAFPAGTASRAYVATGLNFPDALAGAAAAGFFGSPILLVPGGSLPGSVSAEITRLLARTIVILGGTAVVTSDVETDLEALLGL
ncbi:MAG TPA: cell wall-binding repeat-containing protein [Acidimicrobiia bacterium]|nr:cell wall-binding repeat-containing protein [Acidimicrobiia bacterium]